MRRRAYSMETIGDAHMGVAENVEKHLRALAKKMSGTVEVGFLEGATYENGTPVAAVAFWNEYGSSGPPRPFFRQMIANEKGSWPEKLAGALAHTKDDADKALRLVGEDIQGALIQSINDFTTPGLAASTIKRKGFAKPLIDKAIMVNSTGVRVVK